MILFLLVLTATTSLFCDNLPIIDRFTTLSGLSDNTIRCISQDTTGYLWFGSLNGLNRFDGIKIKSLVPETGSKSSLSSGKIKDVYKDSYGHIWIRTYSDIIHCYDPFTEKFIYNNNAGVLVKHNLFYEDNDKNIWLGSATSGCVKISFSENEIKSSSFSTTQGNLPSNTIKDIYQDKTGKIWILTSSGIRVFQNNHFLKLKGNHLENRSFFKTFEFGSSVFIVAENGEVLKFDKNTLIQTGKSSLGNNITVIKAIQLGAEKVIISADHKGLFLYNLANNALVPDKIFMGENIAGQPNVRSDSRGNVWINNFTGNVWMINNKMPKAIKLNLIPASILIRIDEERFMFQPDNHNNVWITTYGNGLFCYNLQNGNLNHYISDNSNTSISSNYLLSIILDKNENIWVGTENMGVNKLSFRNREVNIVFPDPVSGVKNGNEVRALFEDHKKNIWVATKAGNLYKYNSTLTEKKQLISSNYKIYSINEDNKGSVWLGTRGNGLIELKNGEINNSVYYQNTPTKNSLSNNNVFHILFDKKGRLWVATFGGGLCLKSDFNNTEGFITFFNNDEWIKYTRFIYEDKKGDIWVATSNGILRFQPEQLLKNQKNFKHYTFSTDIANGLSNPEIRYIFQDSKGRMWFATSGGGLNEFVGETEKGEGIFKVYKNQQGISNDNIMSIQEDRTGNLWLSTESGLHTFNPESNLFQFYKFTDDFTSNIFSESTCLTTRGGRMFWGSMKGFYTFQPEKINKNKANSKKVVLTGFYIYDQEAQIAPHGSPLTKSISYSDKIVLKSTDKVFHIEFANLDFVDPKANQFMFILENYEKRWNTTGAYNIATYRNVPPGTYTFKVKSINSLGEWDNNFTSIQIVIKPPFWLSGWAFFLYFILLIVLSYIAYNIILKFYRLDNAVKVERQLTDYKLRFFTNISHEFRTPLTLIKGSVDTLNELKPKMSESFQQLVGDLDKNTSHMLRLIEQLLEFRKLQNNKQKLNLQRVDVVEFLNEIFGSFVNVANKSHIEYKFLPSRNKIPVYIDKNKIDKIVFNLLSNAFKFTPRGGKITLIADADENTQLLRIIVADNGIGIPKDKQNQLFSRFMQINFSESGTGIGLSLVNEFVTLHKGKVYYSENEGGGAVFTIELSLNKSIYQQDDFVTEPLVSSTINKTEKYKISDFIIANEKDSILDLVPHVPSLNRKYKVLVIDDNDDIRDFLDSKLSPYFTVLTAEDGNIGIQKGMNDDPDLIICDVMMPGMNGFELTRKLKDDFTTCHIPVIILTAYTADDMNTEGIDAGADAYITKPFSLQHLMLQINKLIEKRERLHKHYSSEEQDPMQESEITEDLPEKDNIFLKKMEEILDVNLSNADFNVDEFALLMNTGRTLFFKKIKFLTGYSPNEFIRIKRMKKAAELLKTYKYNVSEVSYMVGINDPFYFSKCFKSQFGCSPSKYLNT